MNKDIKIGLAVAFQVMVIFVLIMVKLMTLSGGREILIHLLPVDPRDPLRGDYVTYQHDLTTVGGYYYGMEAADEEQFRQGEVVYVSLVESDGFSYPAGMFHAKPADGIFIKGRIVSVDTSPDSSYEKPTYRLDYGIEQYFIPEGKGQMFTTWTQDRQAFAKVAVDTDGTPVLKQLYVDGKPWP